MKVWPVECLSADTALFAQGHSDKIEAKVRGASEELGRNFLRRIESLNELGKQSLCFLDVVAIPSPGLSRGFLIIPDGADGTAEKSYTSVVRALLDDKKSVGDHPVFADGLIGWAQPEYGPLQTPLKWIAWSRNNEDLGAHPSYLSAMVAVGAHTESDQVRASTLRVIPISYQNDERPSQGTPRYGGQNAVLEENVKHFVQLLSERATSLRSLDGKPLSCIILVPVCTTMRNDKGKVIPLRYGSFFLGTSTSPAESTNWISSVRQMDIEQVGAGYLSVLSQRRGRGKGCH